MEDRRIGPVFVRDFCCEPCLHKPSLCYITNRNNFKTLEVSLDDLYSR